VYRSKMTSRFHKVLRSIFLLLLGVSALGSVTAFMVEDCRPQSGKPINQTNCTSIIGGAGNNQITVEKGMTINGPFFGDGVVGNGGDDTIINNGTTVSTGEVTGENGDIEGDVATGNGGNDVIVNNGTVGGDMDGDTVLGNGGNDTLINNGSVADDMDGDNASHNGGDDLIINNGTVGGDIEADDNTTAKNSRGGNDIIIVNGTVEGSVFGDFGVAIGGDDTVVLQNGANGGSDHDMYIDGNDGNDVLIFNFTVKDQSTLDALASQIGSANSSSGSLSFNGQTFTWKNFERLQNQLVLDGQTSANVFAHDEQVVASSHSTDKPTAAVVCMTHSVRVVSSDAQGHSQYLFSVKGEKVASAIKQAAANKMQVQLGAQDGQSLWALPSGELYLQDDTGHYDLTFTGNGCGV